MCINYLNSLKSSRGKKRLQVSRIHTRETARICCCFFYDSCILDNRMKKNRDIRRKKMAGFVKSRSH